MFMEQMSTCDLMLCCVPKTLTTQWKSSKVYLAYVLNVSVEPTHLRLTMADSHCFEAREYRELSVFVLVQPFHSSSMAVASSSSATTATVRDPATIASPSGFADGAWLWETGLRG